MTPSPTGVRIAGTRLSGDLGICVALAAGLTLLAFVTTGAGLDESITVSAANTWAEIALTLIGAGACATMLLLGARGRPWGAVTVALFLALTLLTALSIVWSVQPDNSWQAANLTLAYLATFAAAAALARLAPERWRAVVGAILITTVILCAYGLATKVFPSTGNTMAGFRIRSVTGTRPASRRRSGSGRACGRGTAAT